MPSSESTTLPPHSRAKHAILRGYLQAWFPIMVQSGRAKCVRYIDGFCGPGRYPDGSAGSPIVALEAAIVAAGQARSTSVPHVFDFVDEDPGHTATLAREIERLSPPAHFQVTVRTGDLVTSLPDILATIADREAVFSFLDPYGFQVTPDLVSRLAPIGVGMREVLLYFPVREANRFRTHPNLATVMGARGIQEQTMGVQAIRGTVRTVLGAEDRFVLCFSMTDQTRSPVYDLFFVTGHKSGFVKMKEAMWKVDPRGAFRFSDANDPSQQTLFAVWDASALGRPLLERFSGKTVLTDDVYDFVERDTPYLEKHGREVLKQAEGAGRLSVSVEKNDRSPRRPGTFPPGLTVTFRGR